VRVLEQRAEKTEASFPVYRTVSFRRSFSIQVQQKFQTAHKQKQYRRPDQASNPKSHVGVACLGRDDSHLGSHADRRARPRWLHEMRV